MTNLSTAYYIIICLHWLIKFSTCKNLEGIGPSNLLSTTHLENTQGPDHSNERFTAHDSSYFTSHEATFSGVHETETNSSDDAISSYRICPSIDVRNSVENLKVLRGCKVVEGSVQIVLIDHANDTDYDEYSFPELREITHYLMFYRVAGLRSVGQLFPSLSLIRGNYVFEDYALIIYEMFQLQEVGLHSLTEIVRGAVRIERNPSLCFLDTVNWDLIARWDSVKNYISRNKKTADCPGHAVCRDAGCPQGLCWSTTHCQMHMINGSYTECDKECMGGCSGPGPYNCYSCRKYLTFEGMCVSTCPNGTYLHLNDRCVTKEFCLSLGNRRKDAAKLIRFVVFNGTCIQDCPPGYDLTQDKESCEKCEKGKCRKVCQAQNIYDIASAQYLKGCTFINGSLEITIKHGESKTIFEELEESLKAVEEIEGYLKIVRCFPMVNLKFFRNLEIIHGAEYLLENRKYSLIILDNQNLQELWEITPNFKIMNGRMFFHYNPKLCLNIIEHLIEITGQTNVSNFEVAQDSNGDKFACNTTAVEIKFPQITSNLVLIHIFFPNRTMYRPNLQRYVLYYTEAESRNMTVFEETDECDYDRWKSRDILVENDNQVSSIQPNLKPYTEYAFYVKTYTVHSIGGQSPIYYIRTLPSRPSSVAITLSYSNSSSEIVLEWEPPTHPNGMIIEYIISGFWQKDDQNKLNGRNYCQNPVEESKIDKLHPEFLTRVYNETKQCCRENKITYYGIGKYKKLCDNLKIYQFPLFTETEEHKIDCNKFSYAFIDSEKGQLLENIEAKQFAKFTKRDRNSKNVFDMSKKVKGSQLKIQYNERYFGRANNESTAFVIKKLEPFSLYSILIRACRQKLDSEKDSDYNKRCSKSEITTVRTLKDLEADMVKIEQVSHEIIEGWSVEAIEIKWPIPERPNGIVLAFEIEYHRSDLEHATGITECLTYDEFVKNNNKYKLLGLPPGTYSYRIRTMSLAGLGPFTKTLTFQINRISSKTYYYLLAILLMCILSIVTAVFYVVQQRRTNLLDLDQLIASDYTDQLSTPPYIEDSWEIPRENIEIIKELGQGTFGKVYEGVLLPMGMSCAVKASTSSSQSEPSFLKETAVMKRASGVHHMVQLLGVVSRGGPPLVVMELMALGDLKSYLRSRREQPPDNPRVLFMAAQIADAMFFMETNRFVHRDLAARNCMVHKDLTVKVGDFGLTRDIYSTDYYRKSAEVLLPVRWMPPESLRDGLFTSQSDVWSYGVVLWEIATLAELPYRGSTNEQVVRMVVAGASLSSPLFCPEPLKSMMAECWQQQPNQRPTFAKLMARLTPHATETFKCVSYYHAAATEQEPRVTLFF